VAAAILAGAGFMEIVPTFILGGLLIYVGLKFLIDWVWKARGELPLSDCVVVLIIFVVVIFSDIFQTFCRALHLVSSLRLFCLQLTTQNAVS